MAPSIVNLIEETGPDGPGVHALIIGVSKYSHLADGEKEAKRTYGMGQLDSAAQTAATIAEWIASPQTLLRQPVKSLRLLASPSSYETHSLLAKAAPATLENVQAALWAWREDAARHSESTTFFYFAGHGIQRARGEALLLLQDFLAPQGSLLRNALDLSTIYNGMVEPGFPSVAQLQLYFLDTCRSDIPDIRQFLSPQAGDLWDITLGGVDNRVAPIFFASSAGNSTFGSMVPGGVSAFGRDFLDCVRGGAADNIRLDARTRGWAVTIGTLAQALPKFIERHNRTVQGRPRTVVVDKFTKTDPVISRLDRPPMVSCKLIFSPDGVHTHAELSLVDAQDIAHPVDGPFKNPHTFMKPAGTYLLRASVAATRTPPLRDAPREWVSVMPPEAEIPVHFGDE